MKYDELVKSTPSELSQMSIDDINTLFDMAKDCLFEHGQNLAILQSELERRYAKGINSPGTHHRTEPEFNIKITIPKNVSWDAGKLADAVATIGLWNENPLDYIQNKITVEEGKYNAWPPAIRDVFEPARTVKMGKPKFEITRKE